MLWRTAPKSRDSLVFFGHGSLENRRGCPEILWRTAVFRPPTRLIVRVGEAIFAFMDIWSSILNRSLQRRYRAACSRKRHPLACFGCLFCRMLPAGLANPVFRLTSPRHLNTPVRHSLPAHERYETRRSMLRIRSRTRYREAPDQSGDGPGQTSKPRAQDMSTPPTRRRSRPARVATLALDSVTYVCNIHLLTAQK